MTALLDETLGVHYFRIVASTGSAAVNIEGLTMYTCEKIPATRGQFRELTTEIKRKIQAESKDTRCVIFGECSMVLLVMVDQINK